MASTAPREAVITKWILNFAKRPRARRSVSVLPLQTTGATDWEFFRVHNEFFLVVAKAYNYDPQAAELSERYKTNSTIYRLNKQRKQFEKYQDIVTYRYGMSVAEDRRRRLNRGSVSGFL